MRRAKIAWILGLFLLSPAWAVPPQPWPAPGFQRGIVYSSWDGSYPHEAAWRAHLTRFRELGITWIQVLTFAHQPAVDRPEIERDRAPWPTAFITEARKQGFRILLKPDVWSRQFYDGSNRWRGSIRMADEATWQAWFAQYEAFILDEAKRAAAAGVELFSIGLEYVEATRGHDAKWRALIAKIRTVYSGQLTYAADYNHEIGHITFWDALDVIGVNGYFKLADQENPSLEVLTAGARPHLLRLEVLAGHYKKPVVFTEVGFPSVSTAAQAPWQWPQGTEKVDLELQARAFEVLLTGCGRAPWCGGMYWWKYYERPEKASHAHDYDPAGKPAEAVLQRWYRQVSPTHP
jgi:predicted DNA-binding protein with PD1-like motif